MKSYKSWRKRVNGLLSAIMVIVLLFLMWSNLYYNIQTIERIKSENMTTVKVWESFVKKRLDTQYEHVFELLLTVYNNAELANGTPQMEYMTRKKCLDLMNNKLQHNSDADCFYLIDTQSDMSLFAVNPSISPFYAVPLKNSFKEVALSRSTRLYDRLWRIESIGGEAYFVKSIALGKYVAGTMSRVRRYDITQNFSVLGTAISFLFVSGDEVYYCGGDTDWAEWINFDEHNLTESTGHKTVTMELSFTQKNTSVILSTQPSSNKANFVTSTIAVIILFVSIACCGSF